MPRGRVGEHIGNRDNGQPSAYGAIGIWGLQEAFDARRRSSWPTVLDPRAQGFGIGQNPSDVNASCTFTATFDANAYRTGRWEDPITVSWQKASRNADTPITGNPWVGDEPSTGDLQYANAPAPVPYIQQNSATIATSASGDPYFKNVVLLLSMDTGFVDLSSYARPFTNSPGAVINSSVKMYGTASGEFDGASGIAVTTKNVDMGFGSGDFTVEAWIYLRSGGKSACIISEQHVGTPITFAFGVHGAGGGFEGFGQRLFFGSYYYGWYVHLVADRDVPLNQWAHVATVRSGNQLFIFLNGVRVAYTTINYTFPEPTLGFNIGRRWDNTSSNPFFDGYIDELRVTKGVARYTLNFTPPSTAFPTSAAGDADFSYVTALFPFTTSLNDQSSFASPSTPMTVTGTVQLATTTTNGLIGGQSAYFDGNSYLSRVWSRSSGLIGTAQGNNFTVEGWFKFSNVSKGYQGLIAHHGANDGNGWLLLLEDNNRIYFYANESGTWWSGWDVAIDSGFTPTLNKWHHIAVMRKYDTVMIFVDGVFRASQQFAGVIDDPPLAPSTFVLGSWPHTWRGRVNFEGYMQQIRITNGALSSTGGAVGNIGARYPASFTPPTAAAPTTWADADAYSSSVALLVNFEKGPSDISDNRFAGVMSNSSTITASNKKYGTYSLTNGSVGFNGDITLLSSFTVEGWYYFNSTTTKRYLFSSGTLGVNLTDLYLEAGKLYLQINGGSAQTFSGTQHVSQGNWTHIAIVRDVAVSASAVKCFVDGVNIGDFAYSGQVGDTTLEKSTYVFAAANDYVDDFRITRAARYSGTFSPPAAFNNGNKIYYLTVSTAGNNAINGDYYPIVAGGSNTYNFKQFYRKTDNMYCLFWSNGYWIIHEADGNGNPSGSWQYYSDGYNWTTIQKYPLQFSQPLSAQLVLNNLTFADNATYYRIEARSGFQTAVSNAALLTVEPLSVSFTTQPQDQTISSLVTASVTFTAAAVGIGRTTGQTYSSFTYQWQKRAAGADGWQDIPFATGTSLTDTALTAGTDNGNQYRVRAGCGTSNIGYSRIATLTVT
jgi:hypothetical protein